MSLAPRARGASDIGRARSEEHTSELQSRPHLVCPLLLEKKNSNHAVVESDKRDVEAVRKHENRRADTLLELHGLREPFVGSEHAADNAPMTESHHDEFEM